MQNQISGLFNKSVCYPLFIPASLQPNIELFPQYFNSEALNLEFPLAVILPLEMLETPRF